MPPRPGAVAMAAMGSLAGADIGLKSMKLAYYIGYFAGYFRTSAPGNLPVILLESSETG